MIKRLSVIIALGIALSLSACGNTDKAVNEPTEAEKVTEAIESTPEVTEEPETATEEAEELPVIYADDEVMLRASRALLAFKADVNKDIFIEENVLEF